MSVPLQENDTKVIFTFKENILEFIQNDIKEHNNVKDYLDTIKKIKKYSVLDDHSEDEDDDDNSSQGFLL